MDDSSLDRLPPNRLALLLDVEESGRWEKRELAGILEHQLAAPLLPDVGLAAGAEMERLKQLVAKRHGAESFLRQLTCINPSLELLEAIKRFARCQREDPASPLFETGGTLLYYAAIAAALLRCKARITQLTDAQLREGFAWGMQQPAVELRLLFTSALEQLSAAE